MRSAVDFPHPDGPTSTMSSPSFTSRSSASTAVVSPLNRLVTPRNSTSLIRLALHARGGERLDEPPLGDDEHEQHRCERDHVAGHEERPTRLVGPLERGQP